MIVVGDAQDRIVGDARIKIGDIDNVMTILPKPLYDLPINTLVD